ncbi:NWD2-like protein [Mya arenaria]|uniref:NWD2-like protein n=1 Tax=Mya arenaria TaxID=6604 RepID=A0ABY7DPM1_MYAAR|nr:NWD2-like protein [Mya arenaria]
MGPMSTDPRGSGGMPEVAVDPGLLDGTLDEVPEVGSKIIRVFLSSTFSDMAEERNMLLEDVYPRIQEYSRRKYGVDFQMVDMRWGVTNEVLMGQKYGYRPIPAFIEAAEFEGMRALLAAEGEDAEGLATLGRWYIRDDNSVPPQYVLQPIDSVLTNYHSPKEELKRRAREDWDDTFEEIREVLMAGANLAFKTGLIGAQGRDKYFSSEIEDLSENINNLRAVKFLDLYPRENGEPAEVDTDAQERLKRLRNYMIPKLLNKENIVKLTTKWSDKGGINVVDNKDYLQRLGEAFYTKMVWLIDRNLNDKTIEEDEHARELRESLLFRNKWSRIFFGRTELLTLVRKYVQEGGRSAPMIVYGESGTGKTAVIAKCARELKGWLPGMSPIIVVRFLGTSPRSSHLHLLLRSLSLQICDVVGFPRKDIPTEFKELVAFFHTLLKRASEQPRPIVLFLDSVDQLASSGEPYTFHWLPRQLPPNVKIVLSLVPSVNNLLSRFRAHMDTFKFTAEPIPPLGDTMCLDIVRARLDDNGRTISKDQSGVMKAAFSRCGLPLYTRVMLDEIQTWKSYTHVSLEKVSATLKEALNFFFRRLETQHGSTLVRHALSYITASREGVSEMELLDLLSLDDEVLNSIFLFWLPPVRRLPPFLWTRLRIDLDQFLVERDAGNTAVFTWYHRMFKEAAMERYLADNETRVNIHSSLADYFAGNWFRKKKPFKFSSFLMSRLSLKSGDGEEERHVSEQPLMFKQNRKLSQFNKRKLTELPYHQLKSARTEEFRDKCVFNYEWLWAKLSASGLQLLLEDLELALATSDDADTDIQTLADTIRIAGSTLNDHPENLALEITGRLIDLMDTSPRIRNLIKDCDVHGAAHSALVAPFQMYEVPISSLISSIENMPSDIGDTIMVKNDSRIIAVCRDGTVLSIDTQKGVPVKQVSLSKVKSNSFQNIDLYANRNERYVVCECRSAKVVYVFDVDILEVKNEHRMSMATALHNTYVSEKYLCIDSTVFELSSGKKVRELNKYNKKMGSFVELAITIDEKYLLIGDADVVGMYNIETGKHVKDLPLPSTASVIKLTRDGRLAVVGTTNACVIKVFDVNDRSNTFGLEAVTYDPQKAFPDLIMTEDNYATKEVSEVCLAHKEGAFVSLVKRKYPIVWSLKNVSTKPRLLSIPQSSGPFRYLFQVQFSADDKFVLAAELSPNIMMWDSVKGDLVATFTAHENDLHSLVVGSKNNIASTVQANGTVIKVWDLYKVMTMEKMSSVKSQEMSVKNVTLLNQSNLLFMSKVHPPKSRKAYHFIDYFGVEVLNFTTGKNTTLLPFDKYGHIETLSCSEDASVMVVNISGMRASSIAVVDLKNDRLLTLKTPECRGVIISPDGHFMCLLLKANPMRVDLYNIQNTEAIEKIASFDGCRNALFTRSGAFVGVRGSQLLVRQSVMDEEELTLDLHGKVVATHASEAAGLLLVSADDGLHFTVTAFRTDSFGAIGTITDVSKGGISDVADDGSVCIDAQLQGPA